MTRSTLTSKFQTTVPKEVRQKLGLRPQDILHWEVEGQDVRITLAKSKFLDRRGSVLVGPGSAVDDVREARRQRGKEMS